MIRHEIEKNKVTRASTAAAQTARLCVAVMVCGLMPAAAHAQIYNWQTGHVIPGTESIAPGPDIDLSYWNSDSHNLRFADLSGGLDLHGAWLNNSWLNSARFADANLAGAQIWESTLSNVDLTDANLQGADMSFSDVSGATFAGQPSLAPTSCKCRA